MHFVLPLGAKAPGAAGVPPEGCVPLAAAGDEARLTVLPASRRPSRVLAFAGDRLLAAGDDGRVAIWDS